MGGVLLSLYMLQFKYPLILSLLLLATSCSTGGTSNGKTDDSQTPGIVSEETVPENAVATNPSGLPTVIDFSATWCPPCKMIAPAVHELAEKSKDTVNFEFIDIDKNREMAAKYGVEAVPTFVILDADGKEVNRIVGADIEGLTAAVKAVTK